MHLTKNHRSAPGVWSIVNESGAIVRRLGEKDADYESGVRALVASSAPRTITAAADDDPYLVPWASDAICFVGVETSDNRIIDNPVSFRSFPLPVMAAFQTSWGHDGAYVVGRMDEGSNAGENVPATGHIDTLLPMGLQAARMVDTGSLNRVSIDPSGGSVEVEVTERDEDGWATEWMDHYIDLEIGGLTLVNITAFAESKMRLTGPIPGLEVTDEEAVAASAAAPTSVDPPVSFFEDPQLSGRTRLTIDEPDDLGHRRVYGHLAPWLECHIGITGQCVMAPHSASNYAWFQLGSLKCDEGCVIPIGCITFRGKHAEKYLTARGATDHYDATCMQFADIAIGEDDHGIWFSGAVRTTATDEDIREMRASRLSGDWRKVNGDLELVAAHAVNTGGFPVYEEALAADGSVQTVIAALDTDDEGVELANLFGVDHALRKAFAPLFAERVEKLRERMHA